jgi:beta-galactosidase
MTDTIRSLPHCEIWRDTDGNPIQAHGGGLLNHEGVYYWYGENKDGPTLSAETVGYRVDAIGVSCYSSSDLLNWRNRGIVLPVSDNPDHDLHPSKVVERPKVIYCQKTGRYVMWLHIDKRDYRQAAVGVAVSDSPVGPFRYLQTLRPLGLDSRDQTVFVDEHQIAWHIASTNWNKTTLISRLADDYQSFTGESLRVFSDRRMEAHALIRDQGRYWFVASGCTGWDPNPARSAVAADLAGPWTELGNPCTGPESEITFHCQSTFLFKKADDQVVAMFDRWIKEDLQTSRYVWLPVEFGDGRMEIPWRERWEG